MKKKFEAELTSIAHRILQMKHKDDVRELHHETQKLYEKLSVLLFVEENFGDIKPTIGLPEIEAKLEKAFDFDEKIVVAEIKEEADELVVESKKEATPTEKTIKEEPIKKEAVEEIKVETPPTEIVAKEEPKQEPIAEVVIEEPKVEVKVPIIEIPKPDRKQVSIDDILGEMQPEPIFDRVNNSKEAAEIFKIIDTKIEEKATPEVKEEIKPDVKLETAFIDINKEKEVVFEKADPKPAINLNDKLNKKINIGLNDRIAFEKNLFGGSSEDFNRVVSQLSTFDNLEDAKNFIEELVKPDYNDWKGQDEFASRFMEFVENKFL